MCQFNLNQNLNEYIPSIFHISQTMTKTLKTILVLFVFLFLSNSSCPDNCLECDPSGSVCFACNHGLGMNVFGQCNQNIIDKCVIYGPSDQCFNCQPTFKLEKDVCVKDYSGCVISNSNDGSCFDCGYGTILEGRMCTGVLNCAEYDGTCRKCRQGYDLKENICRDISAGCQKVRELDGLCQKCKQEYNYIGYNCIHQDIIVPRCYIYNNEGACLSCQQGFKIYEKKCLISSQIQEEERKKAEQLLQIKDIENCNVRDVGNPLNCLICELGFYPSNGACLPVSRFCDQYNPQTGQCFDCKFNLLFQSGKCLDEQCIKQTNQICQQCNEPFEVNSDGVCEYNDPNCLSIIRSRCEKCQQGYYIDFEGKCKKLPPNCQVANFQTGDCLQCVEKFTIVNRKCQKEIVIENCQVYDFANYGKCLICAASFYPSGNQCLKVSSLCGEYNAQTGHCFSCFHNSLKLQEGRCIDENCLSLNQDETCSNCRPNFIFNSKQKICKFYDPNCVQLRTTTCLQCKQGFYVGEDKSCRGLPANCAQATPQGKCIYCQNNFKLINEICEVAISIPNCEKIDYVGKKCFSCEDRYYISGNTCSAVPSECLRYDKSNGRCFQCKAGFTLQFGQCIFISKPPEEPSVKEPTKQIKTPQTVKSSDPNCLGSNQSGVCTKCSNRYYLSQANQCVPINPLCRTHNNLGQCLSCYPGFSLQNGLCQIGTLTDPNCKRPKNGACLQCYFGFYYHSYDKICKRANPLCRTLNSENGACLSCYPGYQLNSHAGICQIFFKDPNCLEYSGSQCIQCANRYYVSEQTGKCQNVAPLCQNYNSKGLCTSCYRGYGLHQGTCILGVLQDPNCKNFSDGFCSQCYPRYYSKNGQCQRVDEDCATYDQKSGLCTSCYPGYSIANGKCSQGGNRDPNCKDFSPSSYNYCIKCYSGYIALNGICEQRNPLCKEVNEMNGDCTECWRGYTLYNGNCLLQNQIKSVESKQKKIDPYCFQVSDGLCVKCIDTFYYDTQEKMCKQVSAQCKTYDEATGACLTCWPGYQIMGRQCEERRKVNIPFCINTNPIGQCIQCLQSYYVSDHACKAVSLLCRGYNKLTGECTGCLTNYFLQEGECIFPGLFDINCIYYESSYCSSCKEGFYLKSYECHQVNPECLKFDYEENQCEACRNGKQPYNQGCI